MGRRWPGSNSPSAIAVTSRSAIRSPGGAHRHRGQQGPEGFGRVGGFGHRQASAPDPPVKNPAMNRAIVRAPDTMLASSTASSVP